VSIAASLLHPCDHVRDIRPATGREIIEFGLVELAERSRASAPLLVFGDERGQ
jgi:hypothetical protein